MSKREKKKETDPKREACVCDLLISEEKERQRGAAIKKMMPWSAPVKRVISRKNLSSHDHSHQRGTKRTKNEPNGRIKKKIRFKDSHKLAENLWSVFLVQQRVIPIKTVPIFSFELWNLTYSHGLLIARRQIYCCIIAQETYWTFLSYV